MRGFFYGVLLILLVSPLVLAAPAAPEEALGVDRFLREAKIDGGMAAVIGVVSKVDAAKGKFSLTDPKKFGCCDKPENCISGALPVRWSGAMPKENQTARVRGKVVVEGSKLAFEASDVKILADSAK